MADSRINALATTASSTASDDFLVVDGATNGTRKLNAYSPSFGGNTTVAGTLAVNGGDVSASRFAVAAPSNTITGNFTAGSTSNQSFGLRVYAGTSATDYALKIRNVADTLTLLNVDGVGTVSIGATTASTSTSTGALVVSGGVGVAGAAYVGGNATVFGTAGITINNINGLGNDSILTLTQSGVSNAFIKNTATTGDIAIGDGGGTYLRITKGVGVVSLLNTSASTSTSTGALVVSGGVGVAKSIVVGEEILVNRTTSDQTLLRLYGNGGTGTFINFAETSIGGQGTGVAFLRWTRGGNQDRALSVHVSNSAGTSIQATTVDASGNLIQALNGTAPSLTTNSTMTFELTSNTSLKIFVRGSDGTTRSTTLTLA